MNLHPLDIGGILGFLMLGVGLWMLEPWVSLTTCGAILLGFSAMGAARYGGRK